MAIRIMRFVLILSALLCVRAAAEEYAPFPGDLTDFDYVNVAGIQGKASINRAGFNATLKVGMRLGIGDLITVPPNSVVVINYLTDGYLVMMPGSRIQIQNLGRTSRREKIFHYTHGAGVVFNKSGGSYFGSGDIRVSLARGMVSTKDAEFYTSAVPGDTILAVRAGSVDFESKGRKKIPANKRLTSQGSSLTTADITDDQRISFLTAAQYVVMAQRGEELKNPTTYFPLNTPEAEYKSYYSAGNSQMIYSPAYTNNENQAAQYGGPQIEGKYSSPNSARINRDITTSDRVMGGELPYFPADRMGKSRNPDRDYTKDGSPAISSPVVPGDTTDSELWPELFPEDDDSLKYVDPDYPFPQDDAKPRPTPYQRKRAESLRQAAPPPVYAVTPRSEKEPKADFKGAYEMCQNYSSTQSEVDDCVARHIKPEKVPGAVEFPEPPPELNLPMSHEPKIPEYVSLPPVAELPAPMPSLAKPQLPTCRYDILTDYSLTHNNMGVDQLKQDRFASALETFEDALRINPESSDILSNIGITYLRMGAPQKGEKYMKKALSAEPGRLDIHNNYGCVLYAQGKSMQACSEWDMISRQDPKNKTAAANELDFCRQ